MKALGRWESLPVEKRWFTSLVTKSAAKGKPLDSSFLHNFSLKLSMIQRKLAKVSLLHVVVYFFMILLLRLLFPLEKSQSNWDIVTFFTATELDFEYPQITIKECENSLEFIYNIKGCCILVIESLIMSRKTNAILFSIYVPFWKSHLTDFFKSVVIYYLLTPKELSYIKTDCICSYFYHCQIKWWVFYSHVAH